MAPGWCGEGKPSGQGYWGCWGSHLLQRLGPEPCALCLPSQVPRFPRSPRKVGPAHGAHRHLGGLGGTSWCQALLLAVSTRDTPQHDHHGGPEEATELVGNGHAALGSMRYEAGCELWALGSLENTVKVGDRAGLACESRALSVGEDSHLQMAHMVECPEAPHTPVFTFILMPQTICQTLSVSIREWRPLRT